MVLVVCNQGAGRTILSAKALGQDAFPLPPQLLAMASHPWHSLPCRCITPVPAFVVTWASPLCVSLCDCFLLRIPGIGLGPTLLQHNLIFTGCIYKAPFFQIRSHTILRLWVNMNFRGNVIQPSTPLFPLPSFTS